MGNFKLVSDYQPKGDQPRAINELAEGVVRGDRYQTLLGVTGSGKTFTMANVIAAANRPTLVIAHNKTLAAQLYGEFKDLFPENAVEYFVSYYDYYQPEAYVPSSDTYIEKDSSINDEIERMRHSATHSLRTRNDVLIVASVSCIYGLGTARVYVEMAITVERGSELGRDRFLRRLVECQYERNDADFHRRTFRVRGDTVEVFPAYEEDRALRIQFFGDQVEQITEFDPLRGISLSQLDKVVIFPGSHYVTEEEQRRNAILGIREELGDRSRKETLVEFGFRLPSALDNRPLKFHEFESMVPQAVFVSATPAEYELQKSRGVIVEQILRPTGLIDPEVEVRPVGNQVDDLLEEIRKRAAQKERVLVTTLTKRMAEDLTEYYADVGVRVQYLHSDIDALERTAIIRDLRRGEFDVLIGINLLREGLDIPEVSLVAILDADKEGFLRSHVSLIQTIGRAARNIQGRVIMYSDSVTDSMRRALEETNRRREIQRKFNQEHGITPQSVKKNILDLSSTLYRFDGSGLPIAAEGPGDLIAKEEIQSLIAEHSLAMRQAADEMEFERAAEYRDKIALLKEMDLGLKPPSRALLASRPRTEDKPRIRKGPPSRLRRKR